MSFSVFKHVGEGCISGSSSHISSPKRSDSCDTVTEHQRQNREKLSWFTYLRRSSVRRLG